MKYQFFGDIHGETSWKDLLDPEATQVFLGDYFSPYKLQTFEQCRDNFLDILVLKNEKPETILLLGNHDEDHWHIMEEYSRFDYLHVDQIWQLFEGNKDKFQIAYAIGDYLITHAGVTKEWKDKYLPDVNITPKDLADSINSLWLSGKYTAFNFEDNCSPFDCYGTSSTHGPLWVRWNTLCEHNVFKQTYYKQIVGHTIDKDFKYSTNKSSWNLVCIDCLAFQNKSLILDI